MIATEENKESEVFEYFRKHEGLQDLLRIGKFGIEKEHVRCDSSGHLSLTPHPESLGNKAEHPFITTDFSESQVEMITPPLDSVDEAYGFLKTLHKIVLQALPEGEELWLQSMPPILPEEDLIPVAQFGSSHEKTLYRERLSSIYGKSRQMISGSHFNFSFAPDLFEMLATHSDKSPKKLRGEIYLKVVRNLMRHRWFLVGMLGRSPRAHSSLQLKALNSNELLKLCCDFGISIRSSKIGYRNPNPLFTDYCCLEGYQRDLNEHVKSGKLLNPNELYLPIRLKMNPESGEISHIEVRLLDLDPFDPIGLDPASLRLIHLFILFALLEDDSGRFDCDEQETADEMQNQVACRGFSTVEGCAISEARHDLEASGRRIIQRMRELLEPLGLTKMLGYEGVLDHCETIVGNPQEHPASKLIQTYEASDFIASNLETIRRSREQLAGEDFRFYGFEDMELSTQLLLREAVKRGVKFEILDRGENFVRLHKMGHEHYVKQATRTSLDKYSSILLMENKLVTKKVLDRAGIRTPKGDHFTATKLAKEAWYRWVGRPVVVKPKSTNFGIGISILKENLDQNLFEKAIDIAFAQDSEILIEEFIRGKEYRFFMIGGQVVAVLHRVPANVQGDGVHSLAKLVEIKNRDPLRGKGYRTPLEKIRLGEAEAMFLQGQQLDFESIPEAGQIVYLRENSNISTGGDSIDFTEQVHCSYFMIASQAAKTVDVNITGLDMMIENVSEPASSGNYAVIEMNFNPAIHIHCFPYQGKNRRIDECLLNQMGFI